MKVIEGDCLAVMAGMEANSVDAIVTGQNKEDCSMSKEERIRAITIEYCERNIKNGGPEIAA